MTTRDRFQFHFGLIKRKIIRAKNININVFQFHFGLIKSAALQQQRGANINFNSTLV